MSKPRSQTQYLSKFAHYKQQHVQAILQSVQRLWDKPFANSFTLLVIAVSFALPLLLFILLSNIENLGSSWKNNAQISVYLSNTISSQNIEKIVDTLQKDPNIAQIKYVSPEQGLEELGEQLGFSQISGELKHNPLPAVLLITPSLSARDPLKLNQLQVKLQTLPQVEDAVIDMAWLNRFFALMSLCKQGTLILFGLLALSVLIIIGNTIRLIMQAHKDEIDIMQLMGATRSFIQRPFLYMGALYGLIGGILAWMIALSFFLILSHALQKVILVFNSQFHFKLLSFSTTLSLFSLSLLLGLLGSWIVVRIAMR